SATTRFAAGRYMTPLTTIGVASEFGPPGPFPPGGGGTGASLCRRYVHASVRLATFVALICVSGEYPVPATSRRYIGQSAPLCAPRGCWAPPDSTPPRTPRAAGTPDWTRRT